VQTAPTALLAKAKPALREIVSRVSLKARSGYGTAAGAGAARHSCDCRPLRLGLTGPTGLLAIGITLAGSDETSCLSNPDRMMRTVANHGPFDG
jgi:hypothetical protein